MIWPLTGRSATLGSPAIAPLQTPAATTTCPQATTSPPASWTPAMRPRSSIRDRLDAGAGAQRGAGAAGGLGEREHERARVGGVVAGHREREAHRRRERGLQPPCRAGQHALHLQAELDSQRELALERRGLVGVAGDDERAAAAQAGVGARGRLQLLGECRPGARAAQPELQQRQLAGVGLGDGREHPGGDVRRPGAERAALEHADGVPALGSPPGDGEPDGTAADDDDVRCCCVLRHDTSLRRHDPDQLLTVGVTPSQPTIAGSR